LLYRFNRFKQTLANIIFGCAAEIEKKKPKAELVENNRWLKKNIEMLKLSAIVREKEYEVEIRKLKAEAAALRKINQEKEPFVNLGLAIRRRFLEMSVYSAKQGTVRLFRGVISQLILQIQFWTLLFTSIEFGMMYKPSKICMVSPGPRL
jgi:hypothetical protein